jgi:hypothetical protein
MVIGNQSVIGTVDGTTRAIWGNVRTVVVMTALLLAWWCWPGELLASAWQGAAVQ